MKLAKFFAAFAVTLAMAFSCLVPACADNKITLKDEQSGITAHGEFPGNDNTSITVKIDDKKDSRLYERKIEIVFTVFMPYGEGEGDIDTYNGYNGVTISIPYKKSGLNVVGFDTENNAVDTKAEYKDGYYVFTTNDIGDGIYWITDMTPSAKEESEYKFQTLTDRESGITVRGNYPKGSYVVAENVTKQMAEETGEFAPVYWDVKVYNNFKEVSADGTIEVSIPDKENGKTVLMEMTMEQIQKLTDKQDDPDVNYFDRRWFDVKSKYKGGKYVFKASRAGVFCIATDGYYADFGGGERRVSPPTEKLAPFKAPAGITVWVIIAAAFIAAAAVIAIVLKRRKHVE